jgi:hypothetical protein
VGCSLALPLKHGYLLKTSFYFALIPKSDFQSPAVVANVFQNIIKKRRLKMINAQETFVEERTMGLAVVIYYAVTLAAFFIGMYGLFNLIWLAGTAVEQNARSITIL